MAADYDWSAADVSLTFTAFMTMGAVAAIVAGKLQERLQPRTLVRRGRGALRRSALVLLGSVHSLRAVYAFAALGGFGMGTVYPGATMSNLIRFFPDRRAASGLLSAGAGLGAVFWAPLAVALIARFDLAWALRILGVVFFVALAVLTRVIRTAPAGSRRPAGRRHTSSDNVATSPFRDVDWRGMLRTPQFVVLFLLFIAGTLRGMMVIGHGSQIAQEILGITLGRRRCDG